MWFNTLSPSLSVCLSFARLCERRKVMEETTGAQVKRSNKTRNSQIKSRNSQIKRTMYLFLRVFHPFSIFLPSLVFLLLVSSSLFSSLSLSSLLITFLLLFTVIFFHLSLSLSPLSPLSLSLPPHFSSPLFHSLIFPLLLPSFSSSSPSDRQRVFQVPREQLEDQCFRLQEENNLLRQHTRTQEQRLRRYFSNETRFFLFCIT